MDSEATTAAARLLQSAMLDGHRLEQLPDPLRPGDLSAGYAIQATLDRLVGPTVGWKLAATGAAARESMGLDEPVAGRLFERLRRDPPAEIAVDGLGMGVAEGEFAFALGGDLPLRGRAYELEEVADAVAALHPAIEVPESRFRDYLSVGAAQIAADSALAGSFVLGDPVGEWRHLDLAEHPVAMGRNGAPAAEGSGANVMGAPLRALAWLANRPEHGGLRRGQIVLTGSTTVPVPIAPGDEIVADFGDLGRVGARIVAAAEAGASLAAGEEGG